MARATSKAKASTRSTSARKGWATRRAHEKERARKKAAAAAKRADTLRRKEEAKAKRRAAAKKGARRHKARARAASALETLVQAVDNRTRHREIERVRESWHKAKRELYDESDSYDDFLDMLERIAEETDVQWDLAYGPEGSAAA